MCATTRWRRFLSACRPSRCSAAAPSAIKAWRRITTDRSFLAAHAARRSLEMITLASPPMPCTVNALSVSLRPTPPPPLFHRKHSVVTDGTGTAAFARTFKVLYSLDGLLLLQQRRGLYIVCNPITRQWTGLPALPLEPPHDTAFACGFYAHGGPSPSGDGEYRLLCHALLRAAGAGNDWASRKNAADDDHYYYVLSTGTGGGGQPQPRRLGAAPRGNADSPAYRITEQYEVPVAHRGALHWFALHPEAASTGRMLAFDTVSETFLLMAGPPHAQAQQQETTTKVALLELDGGEQLGVAAMQAGEFLTTPTSVAIWALQDYEAEAWTWTLRHRVEVPLVHVGRSGADPARRAVSVGAGGDAILIGDPHVDVLRLYHLRDKRLISHIFLCVGMLPTFLLFRESSVSHAFFDSPPSPGVAYVNFLYQGE